MTEYLNGVCSYHGYLIHVLKVKEVEARMICSHLRQIADQYCLDDLNDAFAITHYTFKSGKCEHMRIFKTEVSQKDVVEMLTAKTFFDYCCKMGKSSLSVMHIVRGIIEKPGFDGMITNGPRGYRIIKNDKPVSLDDEVDDILSMFKSNESQEVSLIDSDKAEVVTSNLFGLGANYIEGCEISTGYGVNVMPLDIISTIESRDVVPKTDCEKGLARAIIIDEAETIPIFVSIKERVYPAMEVDTRVLAKVRANDLGMIGYDYKRLISVDEKVNVVGGYNEETEWNAREAFTEFTRMMQVKDVTGGIVTLYVCDSWLKRLTKEEYNFIAQGGVRYLGGSKSTYNWKITWNSDRKRKDVRYNNSLPFLLKVVPKLYKLSILIAASNMPITSDPKAFLYKVVETYGLEGWKDTIWTMMRDIVQEHEYILSNMNEVYTKDYGDIEMSTDSKYKKSFLSRTRSVEDLEGMFKEEVYYMKSLPWGRYNSWLVSGRIRKEPGKVIGKELKSELKSNRNVKSYYNGLDIIASCVKKTQDRTISGEFYYKLTSDALTEFSRVKWTSGLLSLFFDWIGSKLIITDISVYSHVILVDNHVYLCYEDSMQPMELDVNVLFSNKYEGCYIYKEGVFMWTYLTDIRYLKFVDGNTYLSKVIRNKFRQGDDECLSDDDLLDEKDLLVLTGTFDVD